MEKEQKLQTHPSLKLMDRVRQTLSYYQYSYRTEQSYCRWIKEYIHFLGIKKVPEQRFQKEIGSFLTFLSQERKLSGASQKQALNAIVFLYKRVFDVGIDVNIEPVKTRRKLVLPVVMTKKEVQMVLSRIKGKHLLMARLLYGSGLRLMECIRLRVHSLNFKRNCIYVHPVKGSKDRKVMMPGLVKQDLFNQVETIRQIHLKDLAMGYGQVDLSNAQNLQDKAVGKEFIWQYVFPSKKRATDPRTGMIQRSHVLESGLQKAVKTAIKKTGIKKRVSCNTFRHSFATHMLENNVNIYRVKDLMGHTDIKATEVYTHVMEKNDDRILSPLDML